MTSWCGGRTVATNASLRTPFWKVTSGTPERKARFACTAANTSCVLTVRNASSGRKSSVSDAAIWAVKEPRAPSTCKPSRRIAPTCAERPIKVTFCPARLSSAPSAPPMAPAPMIAIRVMVPSLNKWRPRAEVYPGAMCYKGGSIGCERKRQRGYPARIGIAPEGRGICASPAIFGHAAAKQRNEHGPADHRALRRIYPRTARAARVHQAPHRARRQQRRGDGGAAAVGEQLCVRRHGGAGRCAHRGEPHRLPGRLRPDPRLSRPAEGDGEADRKSTRLNSS